MLLLFIIYYYIISLPVNITHPLVMCHSKLLKEDAPNLQKLYGLSNPSHVEDNCDYLDIDSWVDLNDEPNSITLIQLNM